jgi:hypothetical protein
MSSSKFNASSRASVISKRAPIFEFKAITTPEHSVNFQASFKDASAAKKRTANIWTIDVFPDATTIHMYIEYHCALHAKAVDDRTHPKVTVPTLAAYCTAIYYGYILLNDMHVRPEPSNFASDYHNQHYKYEFSDFLLSLPVPEFMSPVLKYLSATAPETASHVVFCPSAAGFSHQYFFGLTVPVIAYTNIHDITASLPGNINPNTAITEVMAAPLYTLTRQSATTATAITITLAHLLAACIEKTSANNIDTYRNYASRRRQMFDSCFNPVLFRDYQRRQSLASINLRAPTFATHRYNPYDYIFAASPTNLKELKVVFSSVAATINGAIPLAGSLSSMFENISGTTILTHGYAQPRLPVYHYINVAADIDPTTTTIRMTKDYAPEFATEIQWLTVPTMTHDSLRHTVARDATARCDTDHAHPVTVTQGSTTYNLLRNTAPADPPTNALAPTPFIAFNEQTHVYPAVQVLCVGSQDEENAWMTTCFGMIVRSFEIDGSGISCPDPSVSNGLENVCFADSALAYTNTVKATSINLTSEHQARSRVQVRRNMFKSAIHLLDFSKVWIPRPLLSTFDQLVNNGFPGISFQDNVTWLAMSLSFLGLKTITERDNAHNDTAPPHVAPDLTHAWSPYTYTPAPRSLEFAGNMQFGRLPADSVQYFIMNPRSMFGTLATIVNINDAIESMPTP